MPGAYPELPEDEAPEWAVGLLHRVQSALKDEFPGIRCYIDPGGYPVPGCFVTIDGWLNEDMKFNPARAQRFHAIMAQFASDEQEKRLVYLNNHGLFVYPYFMG